MPELAFQVTEVDHADSSLAPLLYFRLNIRNSPPEEPIQAVLLTTQIQIQAPQRRYTEGEKEKLLELFGPPEVWGRTLRNRLWGHANINIGSFTGSTEVTLPVPCSSDLRLVATNYFHAIESGIVPLLFLFSGTVFYRVAGQLQASRISWDKECVFPFEAQTWRSLMDRYSPNTSWLSLRSEVFERLYAYKRRHAYLSWEETIERLLTTSGDPALTEQETAAT